MAYADYMLSTRIAKHFDRERGRSDIALQTVMAAARVAREAGMVYVLCATRDHCRLLEGLLLHYLHQRRDAQHLSMGSVEFVPLCEVHRLARARYPVLIDHEILCAMWAEEEAWCREKNLRDGGG